MVATFLLIWKGISLSCPGSRVIPLWGGASDPAGGGFGSVVNSIEDLDVAGSSELLLGPLISPFKR
jgi:hypothetical protein